MNGTNTISESTYNINPLYHGGLDALISRIAKESRSLERLERQSQLIELERESKKSKRSSLLEKEGLEDLNDMNQKWEDAEEEKEAVLDDVESRKRARHASVLDGLDESLSLWMDKLASNDLNYVSNMNDSPHSSPPHSPPTLSLSSSSIAGSPLSSSISQLEISPPPIPSVSLPRFFTGGAQACIGNFKEDLDISWNKDITPTNPYVSTLSPKSLSYSHSFTSTSPNLPVISTWTSPSLTKSPTAARIKTITSASASVEDFFEDDLWENKSSGSFEWELVDSPILLDCSELGSDRNASTIGASSVSLGGTVFTSNDGSEVGFLNPNAGGSGKVKPRKLQKRSHSGRQV